ncbi:MAG: aminoacylase [Synergistaceae bacterium]|nr:aminoacylase [Synergistaceae bacterium]
MSEHYDLVLAGGLVFTMRDGEEPFFATVTIADGRVRGIIPGTESVWDSNRSSETAVYDVRGMYVTPGFIDIHAHDEFGDGDIVEQALLRQGVTTALAGNCGSGPLFPESEAAHANPWINLYYLVGNRVLRRAASQNDRYSPCSGEQRRVMCDLLGESMRLGAMGLSLGLEYEPGASFGEICDLARIVAKFDGLVSVHTRFDDYRCVDAVREVIALSRDCGVRVEISHLGSMTMSHTDECADAIDSAKSEGLPVSFDCYPYDAFCTNIGSAVFDDGFAERWRGKGPEYLEAVSGRFAGKRLNWKTFTEMRREEPDGTVIAYIMDQEEVERCVAHPDCVIGSDSYYQGDGGAHPRLSGTFPRALKVLRKRGYGWNGAIKKLTSMPADILRIDAGRLDAGAIADIAVFDPEKFTDRATYEDPFLPPDGMRMVITRGRAALEDGVLSDAPSGKLRKK